jgi:type I restriction enzyme S subunit
MTRIGSLADTRLLDWDVDASIYVSLALLRPGSRISPRYLYAYTKSQAFVRGVEDLSLLWAVPKKINMGDIRKVEVRFPKDAWEQEAIAETLIDVELSVNSIQSLIAKKQAMKQGMMQQLLSGDARLPGFTDPWRRVSLSSGLNFQVGFPFHSSGFNAKASGVRLIRNRDLKSNDSPIYYKGSYQPAFLVTNGDLLIGMDGDFTPCLWRGGVALLNQRVGRLLCSKVDPVFMYYALRRPLKELEASTGATTVKHLSHKDVESLELALPGVTEQKAIADVLKQTDEDLIRLEAHMAKMKAIKRGMMQELLTGRTRLPSEELKA